MASYDQKPLRIDAVQWTGDNVQAVQAVFPGAKNSETQNGAIMIPGKIGGEPSGVLEVPLDHWVILDMGQNTSYVTDEIFQAFYAPVAEE